MNFEDVKKIMIGNVDCIPDERSYMVGRRYNIEISCLVDIVIINRVNCVTDAMDESQSSKITIVTNNGNHSSSDYFNYKVGIM